MEEWVKRLFGCAVALFFIAPRSMAGQEQMTNSGSWSGIIINSNFTPEQAFAEAAECTQKTAGGKLSLFDDTTREIFDLDPQDLAAGQFAGSAVATGCLSPSSDPVFASDQGAGTCL